MGYYTYYTLQVDGAEDDLQKFAEYMNSKEVKDEKTYGYLDSWQHNEWTESLKWYEYADDMTELSLKFPNIMFTLWGEGEDRSDIWVHYFKNGKSQKCFAELVYDDFCGWADLDAES